MGPYFEQAPAYLAASGCAAIVNFPLWKAAAMGQSGFKLTSTTILGRYLESLQPPWRGVTGVVIGMTWARAAIFYGSDVGRQHLLHAGWTPEFATATPPMLISTLVQIVNQPIVRGSVMLQDPSTPNHTLRQALASVCASRGVAAMWHGTSAGILKAVPKYVTAVTVKEWMERSLEPPAAGQQMAGSSSTRSLLRSAKKSVVAGVAGAVLTNPLDVIRNEMFKTDLSLFEAVRQLSRDYPGGRWLVRGCDKNLVAVAVPVACTIFLTDVFSTALL